MDKFHALTEPTRRKIIEMPAREGALTATEICEEFQVSPSAISQHLMVLREANLVRMENGRSSVSTTSIQMPCSSWKIGSSS